MTPDERRAIRERYERFRDSDNMGLTWHLDRERLLDKDIPALLATLVALRFRRVEGSEQGCGS